MNAKTFLLGVMILGCWSIFSDSARAQNEENSKEDAAVQEAQDTTESTVPEYIDVGTSNVEGETRQLSEEETQKVRKQVEKMQREVQAAKSAAQVNSVSNAAEPQKIKAQVDAAKAAKAYRNLPR
ncbi:MAG: hypothetical protein NC930_06810 [Candidatus Omnitrophica bacterium]|nr:hypothetical protein [Candidatus Omnitrophota bacterium]